MNSIKQMLTAVVLAGAALFAQVGNAGDYYDRGYRDDGSSALGVAVLVGVAALLISDRHDRRHHRRHGYSRGYDRGYRGHGYRDRGYRDRGYRDHGRRDRGYRDNGRRHRGW